MSLPSVGSGRTSGVPCLGGRLGVRGGSGLAAAVDEDVNRLNEMLAELIMR